MKEPKILIVDDEPFNLAAIHSIMEIIGIENHIEICEEALNGEQAYETVVEDVQQNQF